MIQEIKNLIKTNQPLIKKTALKDCHCLGLHSFILNTNPKMRLFIAEPDCEMFQKFDPWNPLIPIHPHKYDDDFYQIEGNLIQHIYEEYREYEFNPKAKSLNGYTYNRISDNNEIEIVLQGRVRLRYKGRRKNITFLAAKILHTASLIGSKRSSWLITEGKMDTTFKQIAYHKNLVKRDELYNAFENPVEYLTSWIENLT